MQNRVIWTLALLLISSVLRAGEVTIKRVAFERGPADWSVNITLQHADTGWEHYADAWRIVSPKGEVLATQTLHHPHVKEQPFTRSLSGVNIPARLSKLYIEAHDNVHGWAKDRLAVDLKKPTGSRYIIR